MAVSTQETKPAGKKNQAIPPRAKANRHRMPPKAKKAVPKQKPTSLKSSARAVTKTKGASRPPGNQVRTVRKGLGLTRSAFARMTGFSERAIADWEGGRKINNAAKLRLEELKQLQRELEQIMEPAYIPKWVMTPCEALGGLKPIQAIENGRIDRVWRLLYFMGSGVAT